MEEDEGHTHEIGAGLRGCSGVAPRRRRDGQRRSKHGGLVVRNGKGVSAVEVRGGKDGGRRARWWIEGTWRGWCAWVVACAGKGEEKGVVGNLTTVYIAEGRRQVAAVGGAARRDEAKWRWLDVCEMERIVRRSARGARQSCA